MANGDGRPTRFELRAEGVRREMAAEAVPNDLRKRRDPRADTYDQVFLEHYTPGDPGSLQRAYRALKQVAREKGDEDIARKLEDYNRVPVASPA